MSIAIPLLEHARRWLSRRLRATRRGTCLVLAIAILVPSAFATVASGQEAGITEYRVKAAFLYNFAKFVEWPADAFGGPSAAFRLCVLGDEPFASARDLLSGKTIKGRPVEVARVASVTAAHACHMLFVGAADSGQAGPALVGLQGRTLVVGETEDFTRYGGVINLTRVDNKIRFEIDRAAGERSGFRFSAQLLRLAILVDGGR